MLEKSRKTFPITSGLIISVFLLACGNPPANQNLNTNSNKVIGAAPAPLSAADSAEKTRIEEALKKAGFGNVTVDTATIPFTIRGTVPRDKVAEVIMTARNAAGKDLNNKIIEK